MWCSNQNGVLIFGVAEMHWGCAQLVCAGDLSCVSGIGCAVTSGGGCVQKSLRNGPEDDRAVMLYRSKAGKLAGSLPQLLIFPCFFFYHEFGWAYLQDHRRPPYGKFQDYFQGYIKIIIKKSSKPNYIAPFFYGTFHYAASVLQHLH